MQNKCRDCFYFDSSKFAGTIHGHCKRYPPQRDELIGIHLYAKWVTITIHDWCGEWKKLNGFSKKNGNDNKE